jgi:hypothetical protein
VFSRDFASSANSVLNVEPDGVGQIGGRFLKGISACVAALKLRAERKMAVFILLNHRGEMDTFILGTPFACFNGIDVGEVCS